MSRSEARPRAIQPADAHSASARLGLTFRSILLSPREGYAAALRGTERRAGAGLRPAEGYAPYVLAFVGGIALTLLWLKLGSLLGVRRFCTTDRVAAYVVLALALGGLVALAAQALWGVAGAKTLEALHAPAPGRALRLVWGAAALPQVVGVVLLLPLDLLVVGGDTFTSRPLDDTVTTAWAAFSIAAAISLSVWSLFLFVRGIEIAASTGVRRALLNVLVAAGCIAVVVGVLAGAGLLLSEGGGCPTRLG